MIGLEIVIAVSAVIIAWAITNSSKHRVESKFIEKSEPRLSPYKGKHKRPHVDQQKANAKWFNLLSQVGVGSFVDIQKNEWASESKVSSVIFNWGKKWGKKFSIKTHRFGTQVTRIS